MTVSELKKELDKAPNDVEVKLVTYDSWTKTNIAIWDINEIVSDKYYCLIVHWAQ